MRHCIVRLFAGFLTGLVLFTRPGFSYGDDPGHHARSRTYHVIHYRLDVKPDEHMRNVRGSVTIRFVPLRSEFRSLVLDAAEMTIDRVVMPAGTPLTFDYDPAEESLAIDLGRDYTPSDTLSVIVSYRAKPRKGLYFIQPDSAYPDKPWQVWSQGAVDDNHFWFPCYDYPNDKATSEVFITVPDTQYAVSNGRLLGAAENREARTKTYHWLLEKPVSSYLISVAAGDYIVLRDSCCSIPVDYIVYPADAANAPRSFRKTPDMIRFFSRAIGYDYPWAKYDQTIVHDFVYGGMENVSATTLTDGTIHDGRAQLDVNSEGLVAHELAHQWWGDLLTCCDWASAWLNEGFATYFGALWTEEESGEDAFQQQVAGIMRSVITGDAGSNRRPVVWRGYTDPTDVFGLQIYQKGASVLHMLRFVLGDELFWKSLRYYARAHAFRNVETNDLKLAVEEATGENLWWFFDEWLYRAGYPEYDVTKRWDPSEKKLHLVVRQVQRVDDGTPLFTMPVDVEVTKETGPVVRQITVSREEEEFTFPCSSKPRNVIFDKGDWILKKLTFEKSKDEWLYQRAHGTPLERVEAIRTLSRNLSPKQEKEAVDALVSSATGDLFAAVRVEACRGLAKLTPLPAAKDALFRAARDSSSQVRRAALSALGEFRGSDVIEVLRGAFENDSSYYVAASALESFAKADFTHAFEILSEGLSRDSYSDVIRTAALNGLAELHDPRVLPILESYTGYGKPNGLRILAVQRIGRYGEKSEEIIDRLIALLRDPYIWVRTAAMDALAAAGDTRALHPLEESERTELDGRVKRAARNAIARLSSMHQQ